MWTQQRALRLRYVPDSGLGATVAALPPGGADLDPATVATLQLPADMVGVVGRPAYDDAQATAIATVLERAQVRRDNKTPPLQASQGARDDALATLDLAFATAELAAEALPRLDALGVVQWIQPLVEIGVLDGLASTAPDVVQRHLGSRLGVGVERCWSLLPARGHGVQVAVVEQGWPDEGKGAVVHTELKRRGDPWVRVLGTSNPAYAGHGLAVMGLLAANHGDGGVQGIVPELEALYGVSEVEGGSLTVTPSSRPAAIAQATLLLKEGDVLLLEMAARTGAYTSVPVEIAQDVHELIEAAVTLGVSVVEPTGNSDCELLALPYLPTGAFTPARDSGAILVGGAHESGEEYPLPRGAAVHVHAQGAGVVTTGLNHAIRSDFGGSSAASAIVAGVVALLQSQVLKHDGATLDPHAVRRLLTDGHGRGSLPVGQGIRRRTHVGAMPDINRMLQTLGVLGRSRCRRHTRDSTSWPGVPWSVSPDLFAEPAELGVRVRNLNPDRGAMIQHVQFYTADPGTVYPVSELVPVASTTWTATPGGVDEVRAAYTPARRGHRTVVAKIGPAKDLPALDPTTALHEEVAGGGELVWRDVHHQATAPVQGVVDLGPYRLQRIQPVSFTSAFVVGAESLAGVSALFDGVAGQARPLSLDALPTEVAALLVPHGQQGSDELVRVRMDGPVHLQSSRLLLRPGRAEACTVVVMHEEQGVGLVNISLFHWTHPGTASTPSQGVFTAS